MIVVDDAFHPCHFESSVLVKWLCTIPDALTGLELFLWYNNSMKCFDFKGTVVNYHVYGNEERVPSIVRT